ncbi:hypothetical protein SE17_00015 [Kouleothrix aurantiaca]|uniref:Uncharacterized protein n=1 Tax=Kouleothrix aurantiaca TaxID=186479 RepID=A0A0P9DYG4_9CHLR|nr:hypothetical protein SE17_00015 [Kouleothrix aurantiaca]
MNVRRATDAEKGWAQTQVTAHHYLHRPVDSRCSILTYVVVAEEQLVGCVMFGRPESTRCYTGRLTYGSVADVRSGRAQYSRWEIINLARLWLAPSIQTGGARYIPNAATHAIGLALKQLVVDYLVAYPPVTLAEPWRLQRVISYCDTRIHHGGVYRAAGFTLVRTNAEGIETWARPLRGLQGHERKVIEKLTDQSARSRGYRSKIAVDQHQFFSLL